MTDSCDHGGGLGLLQDSAELRQFDEHHVTELRLRIIRDADGGDVALDAEPFVIGGIPGGRHDKILQRLQVSTFVRVGNKRHGGDPQRQSLSAQLGEHQASRRRVRRVGRYPIATGAATLGPKPPELTRCRPASDHRGRIGEQRRALAHRGASLRLQPDAGARRAVRKTLTRILPAPGKPPARAPAMAAALLDRPLQRRLDRRGGGIDIVAVETEPGLQPQAVAGSRARIGSTSRGPTAPWRAFRPDRREPKSQNRPRRYSRSARQNSRCPVPDAVRHP